MKIRSNYVSNSSSSSFLVKEDLTDKGISCLKLSMEQKKLINGSIAYDQPIVINVEEDWYLTQFISDCDDRKYGLIKGMDHIFYREGQLSEEPREESYYNEYQTGWESSVYLLKEHDEAKQMSFNKFSKIFKSDYGNADVIVKYEGDTITLRLVR